MATTSMIPILVLVYLIVFLIPQGMLPIHCIVRIGSMSLSTLVPICHQSPLTKILTLATAWLAWRNDNHLNNPHPCAGIADSLSNTPRHDASALQSPHRICVALKIGTYLLPEFAGPKPRRSLRVDSRGWQPPQRSTSLCWCQS